MSSEVQIRVEHELFVRSFFGMSPPPRVTRQLTARMRDRHFEAGEVLFQAKTPTRWIHFVVSGTVSMSEDSDDAWSFGPNSMIGIVDANLDRPHQRTARAVTEVHALAIELEDFYDILEDNFDFTRLMLIDAYAATWERSLKLPAEDILPHDPARVAERPWRSVRRLNEVQRLMILHGSCFANGGPVQPLVLLAQQSRERRVGRSEVVMEKGEALDAMWFVADGLLHVDSTTVDPDYEKRRWAARVRQTVHERPVRGRFGPGEIILASAGLGSPRSPIDVVAAEDSVLVGVPREALWDMMEDHFGLARCALAYIARENERIRLRRSELGSSRDLQVAG